VQRSCVVVSSQVHGGCLGEISFISAHISDDFRSTVYSVQTDTPIHCEWIAYYGE